MNNVEVFISSSRTEKGKFRRFLDFYLALSVVLLNLQLFNNLGLKKSVGILPLGFFGIVISIYGFYFYVPKHFAKLGKSHVILSSIWAFCCSNWAIIFFEESWKCHWDQGMILTISAIIGLCCLAINLSFVGWDAGNLAE